jgi:hypothetical protein
MTAQLLWVLAIAVAFLVAIFFIWRPVRAAARETRLAQARRDFHAQRERLEIKFIHLAMANSQVGGPHWEDCEFQDDVCYVRNRSTGELSAFVAVTVEADDFQNPPTSIGDLIGNLRVGTAVFRFDGRRWDTDGKAMLNLNPAEAIRFYQKDLEVVDQELAGRA